MTYAEWIAKNTETEENGKLKLKEKEKKIKEYTTNTSVIIRTTLEHCNWVPPTQCSPRYPKPTLDMASNDVR